MGAAHRLGRAVERGDEPIAGGVDHAACVAQQLQAHDGVVSIEVRPPGQIAQRGRPSCRIDDVREQHRRQHPFASTRSSTREELLDLVDDRVGAAGVRGVIGAGQLDVAGIRDVLAEVPAHGDGHEEILRTVEHECGDVDLREAFAEVGAPSSCR